MEGRREGWQRWYDKRLRLITLLLPQGCTSCVAEPKMHFLFASTILLPSSLVGVPTSPKRISVFISLIRQTLVGLLAIFSPFPNHF